MKLTDLRCVRCGHQPEPAMSDGSDDTPPYHAVIFTSRGNYGSALWDEAIFSPDYLAVVICDACLREQAETGNVMLTQPVPVRTTTTRKLWKPDERRDERSD